MSRARARTNKRLRWPVLVYSLVGVLKDGLPIMADQEIIFTVEDAPEGGYTARALGHAIFTQGETLEELRQMVRDAVNCHFEKENKPHLIRLHMVKDESLWRETAARPFRAGIRAVAPPLRFKKSASLEVTFAFDHILLEVAAYLEISKESLAEELSAKF